MYYFRLETSYRTFYMYAQSEVEADEWVRLLRAKLVCPYIHEII